MSVSSFRKRFVVANRNDSEKNAAAIEAAIKRYEAKTGYIVSRDGMTAGNKMLKYEAFADVRKTVSCPDCGKKVTMTYGVYRDSYKTEQNKTGHLYVCESCYRGA